jgi:CheY-like chemotaxis protein
MHKRETRTLVLVVDDSPGTLRLLTDALEEAGMTVLVARDGEHALSIVEKVVPDVILMDAVMPGTDGFSTCRKLKQNRSLAHVPVIFMTGLSDTEHIIEGLEAGGVDYVTKPIVPGELLARIRSGVFCWPRVVADTCFGTRLRRRSYSGRLLSILIERITRCRTRSSFGSVSAPPRRPGRSQCRLTSVNATLPPGCC